MQHAFFPLMLLCFCLWSRQTAAQFIPSDSVRMLEEFVVEAPRINGFSPGLKSQLFDSSILVKFKHKNLSDLIAIESPLFVKSYGQGSLATTSFRGGSANHTAILWNGFTLSSSMNGILDLSLIPITAADQVSVQFGGNSALYGSGAVAGTIHLSNDSRFNNGLSAGIHVSAGSFSDFRQNANIEISKKRFVSSLKWFNQSAKNNFFYENIFLASRPHVKTSNNELKNQGLISENKILLNSQQVLSFNAWLQHTNRNTPPTMLQTESKTNQIDDAIRLTAQWKLNKNKTATFVRAAWLRETIMYSDSLAGLFEMSLSQQLVSEAESKFTIRPGHFANAGLHHTLASASHPSLQDIPHQNRLALFASYLLTSQNKKLNISLSGRQELTDGTLAPFTYAISSNYAVNTWLHARVHFARVYRIPTFNDLYWNPGGNPELAPEDGYSGDAGLQIAFKQATWSFNSDITVFNRLIDNWIVWLPGVSFWSPQNIMSVHSRGMETNSTFSLPIKKSKISIQVLTNYSPSTNRRPKTANDNSVGRQLIYSPMYSGMAKLTFEQGAFSMSYRHQYVGYRYTSTDNTQFLPPYVLGSVYLAINTQWLKPLTGIFFEINNIWNSQYLVISNRAMPGINFHGGLSFNFNKSNKSQNNSDN